ncbi:hypothetical protein [Methanoregula sp.]|uniref:hypothetical protein n=1 Tax=Methanoregula sp. TaxID=2052170 RepID=UPI00261CF4B0|nr:hypothetical protein [Methanoregula sp.]MDD5142660.1 hypothetical protein [Methanoregula sp.]
MLSLRPSPELTPDEIERGLSNIIFDGLTTHAFVTLTSGIFLIAYGKDMRNFSTAGGIRDIMRFPVNGMDIQSDNYALRCRPDQKSQKNRNGPVP